MNEENKKSPTPAAGLSSGGLLGLLESFPSCASDESGRVWEEEIKCIEQLLKGIELSTNRSYVELINDYAVNWYWVEPEGRIEYPVCYDVVVMRLIGREVLKPVSCGGGATLMVFTERATKVFKPNTSSPANGTE